jgi:Fe-S-cluster containining protein
MKNRENGSCIFLSFNRKEDQHYCSVYNHRPALCRLFPFEFEKSGPKSYTLGYIPCCNGLNKDDGEQVDEKFFARNLLNTFLELMNSKAI